MKALAIVEQPLIYQGAADTYPNDKKYRVQGMPKDAFHIACNAHYTRLMNSLHTPGLSPEERALYQIRAENMKAATSAYIEKQKAALSC